jgi:UDP-xylose:glucoside alpha-1,3-xylosyltransferase
MPDRHLCYAIYQATFPSKNWTNLFRPCASQRLFLPYALPHLNKIIYVDVDSVFLRPVFEIWNEFIKFSDEHIGGLAGEVEEAYQGGYAKYKHFKRPLYPRPAGLNSGVLFMDLEKMRQIPWLKLLSDALSTYKAYIKLGDQDLLNIFFYLRNTTYYRLPCSFNYRTDNCPFNCSEASQNGVAILHANRKIINLKNVKHPFRNIFEAISSLNVTDLRVISETKLTRLFERAILSNNKDIKCCRSADMFTAGLKALARFANSI